MPDPETPKPTRGRRGRRPGGADTRQQILDAARARFARDGFAASTIRKIAADAGVDASLVMQFFRSKDELFAAVMSISPRALDRIASAWAGPDAGIGERLARGFLSMWEEDAGDAEALVAMLRGAIVQEQAAEQLRDFLEARITANLPARWAGGGDALRVRAATSMLVGVIVVRRIVGVRPLADADAESVVATIAPGLQAVLAPGEGATDAS
jgi:AcrR family transcriptional regulator